MALSKINFHFNFENPNEPHYGSTLTLQQYEDRILFLSIFVVVFAFEVGHWLFSRSSISPAFFVLVHG